MVNEFITPPFQCDISKLNECLCSKDVETIVNILISNMAPNKWIWHFYKFGKCSVRSGYKFHMMLKGTASLSDSDRLRKWWKKLWSLKIPIKVKHFVWRAFHACIPTQVNLIKHHVETDKRFPICRKNLETIDHALFRCSRAKKLWRQLHENIKIMDVNHSSIQDRLLELIKSKQDKIFEWICVGMWAMWNDRNNVMHDKQILDIREKCEWVHRYLREFQTICYGGLEAVGRGQSPKIGDLTNNDMVIHADASCDTSRGVFGFGALIWNIHGDVVAAMHGHYPPLQSP